MATFKCKMCGGSLEIASNVTVVECEYCGTPQTLPKLHDEKLNNMFERADQFRRAKDFDKALEIYEEILTEKNDDPEVYWAIVLCKYGIEYVDDPASGQKIPTVNRAQFTSIYDDTDYQSAIRYADTLQKMLYEKEATAINEIQKGILAISSQEDPYDVFICYKETDENGERTHDSVYATELYYELIEMGYKVFFSRITLEEKLGSAYEPYIFAALNSAKVMVVIGTKPEYFNAVWVRNEWSRFLSLMKKDRKRILIPAYRNMDPYNLPKEFSHLQALDMNKLGFMSDLTRGIKKIIGEKQQPQTNQYGDTTTFGNVQSVKTKDFGHSHQEAIYLNAMDDYESYDINRLELAKKTFIALNGYRDSDERVAMCQSKIDQIEESKRLERERRAHEKQINSAKKAAEDTRIAEITRKYNSIPTEDQIKKTVKQTKSIKRWLVAAWILVFLYWPVGIVLFFIRNSKINKAAKKEMAKYDDIRNEYARLKAGTDGTFILTAEKQDQVMLWNPDILMTIGGKTYKVTSASSIIIPLKAGRHSVDFSAAFSKKHININMTKNTKIVFMWNKMTGQIDAKVQ